VATQRLENGPFHDLLDSDDGEPDVQHRNQRGPARALILRRWIQLVPAVQWLQIFGVMVPPGARQVAQG